MTRRKAPTKSAQSPVQHQSRSAWAKGPPPQSNYPSPQSQSPTPLHTSSITSDSRHPSTLRQGTRGVSVRDGLSIPRDTMGSAQLGSVVFGSIDDTSIPLSSSSHSTSIISNSPASTVSTPKPTINKADIAKLFQNPSSTSSPPPCDTSPSTRSPNVPPHHQPSTSLQPRCYTVPFSHMHQPHLHTPHIASPHSLGPPPTCPRTTVPQPPGTPTMGHAITPTLYTPRPPTSTSPSPTTPNKPPHNTIASAFIPGGHPSTKVIVKYPDGTPLTLDELKERGPQLLSLPRNVTRRRTTLVRTESEEAKRLREEALRPEQEKDSVLGSLNVAPVLGVGNDAVSGLVPINADMGTRPDVDSPEIVDRNIKTLLNKLKTKRFDSISDQIIQLANKSVDENGGRSLILLIQLIFEKAMNEAAHSAIYVRLCWRIMDQISPDAQDDGIKDSKGQPIVGGQLFQTYLLNRCEEDFEREPFAGEVKVAPGTFTDRTITDAANKKEGTEEVRLHADKPCTVKSLREKRHALIKFMCGLFVAQILTEHIMHKCVEKLLNNAENPEEEDIEGLYILLRTVGQLLDIPKAQAHMDVYFTRMKELCKSTNISSRIQLMLQYIIELRERKWVSCNGVAAPMTTSALRNTRAILSLNEVEYPEGIKKPNPELNVNVTNGRFRYDREFLMQFMHICKDEPPTLLPLYNLSIGLVDKSSKNRNGPGRHRSASCTISHSAASQSSDLDVNISETFNVQYTERKLTNEEHLSLPPVNSPALASSSLHCSPEVEIPYQGGPTGPSGNNNKRTRSKRGIPGGAPLSQHELPLGGVPANISEADVQKMIDEDVEEFFTTRNLDNADMYFSNLPRNQRYRLVGGLVASALEKQEADVRLLCELFARAARNRHCTPRMFEKGFTPIVELLDDIAIDAPKAFDYMAIMLKGAGFEDKPRYLQRIASKLVDNNKLVSLVTTQAENESYGCQTSMILSGPRCGNDWVVSGGSVLCPSLNPFPGDLSQVGKIIRGTPMAMGDIKEVAEQDLQTDSSLSMSRILESDQAHEPTPEAFTRYGRLTSLKPNVNFAQRGVPEPDSSMCNTLDQSPEALLRQRLQQLPRFKPPVVNKARGT